MIQDICFSSHTHLWNNISNYINIRKEIKNHHLFKSKWHRMIGILNCRQNTQRYCLSFKFNLRELPSQHWDAVVIGASHLRGFLWQHEPQVIPLLFWCSKKKPKEDCKESQHWIILLWGHCQIQSCCGTSINMADNVNGNVTMQA